MTHTVGEVARRAGVTVRTLHHYDEIGLLSPSGRSGAGYRLYDAGDIARLQQILLYRETGLALGEIARVMSDPSFDRVEALHRQRRELAGHTSRLMKMIGAAEKGINMSMDEMLGVFGDFDPKEYEDEARARWGETGGYQESARRTAGYSREDWERHAAAREEIYRAFTSLMQAGVASDSEAAMDVAEQHRSLISEWFYECTPDIHVGLGEMYVQDPRFTANIDLHGEGLAAYMSAAILANAVRVV